MKRRGAVMAIKEYMDKDDPMRPRLWVSHGGHEYNLAIEFTVTRYSETRDACTRETALIEFEYAYNTDVTFKPGDEVVFRASYPEQQMEFVSQGVVSNVGSWISADKAGSRVEVILKK